MTPQTPDVARTRRLLVALLAAVLFINYADRGLLSIAAPLIQSELQLSDRELGLLGSAFFWTYAFVQIPIGWLAERYGAERVLAVQLKGQWSKSTAPRHLFDVIGQSFAIAQDMMSAVWKSAADVVIEPDVAGFDYDNFKRADELIRAGEQAMRAALPEVRKWIESAAAGPYGVPALVPRTAAMPAD